jgi:hypothetical protein
MRNPRILLAAAVAAVAALVMVLVVVLGGGDSDDGGARAGAANSTATAPPADAPALELLPVPAEKARVELKLERAEGAGYEELLVSLPDERMNTPETNANAPTAQLTCVDRGGKQTVRAEHPWPLVVEEGFPPHIHQPALPKVLNTVRRCRREGRGIDFSGSVKNRLPRLPQ